MRYRFRGVIRETGKAVEGHVEGNDPEDAYSILAENGIITESLREDPRPMTMPSPGEGDYEESGRAPPAAPGGAAAGAEFTSALESALDSSATQVPFDALSQRFKGKSVWVIDREKIRHRVAQVVDQAIAQSLQGAENVGETRERVAEAIEGLFRDNRNLSTQVSSQGMALEQQIQRLGQFITKAETVLAQITVAARRGGFGGGSGGGDGPRRYTFKPQTGGGRNEVLLEIFKDNLELQRGIKIDDEKKGEPAAEGSPSPADAAEPESSGNGAGDPLSGEEGAGSAAAATSDNEQRPE